MKLLVEEHEDTAVWQGDVLVSDTWNSYRDGDPHECARLNKVNPCADSFCYWCSIGGACFALAPDSGKTCIANVESALRISGLPMHKGGWCDNSVCYVIWQPKDHSPATWKRWTAKWSKRTAIYTTKAVVTFA